MTGVEILQEVVAIMVGGISGIATGVGQGLSELATAIFLSGTAGEQTLSVFGTLVIVFAGISLAISLSRFVCTWLTSLGN